VNVFLRLLRDRCREIGLKKASKFGFVYALYLAIVWAFDYVYMPWLAIKFHYAAVFPLYISVLAVSLLGLLLYRFFRENVFFLEEIVRWLNKKGESGWLNVTKGKIVRNPKLTFAVISAWWSPLHGYLFFKRDETDHYQEVLKVFSLGSLYCALFWGIIIGILVFIWKTTGLLGFLAILGATFLVWNFVRMRNRKGKSQKIEGRL